MPLTRWRSALLIVLTLLIILLATLWRVDRNLQEKMDAKSFLAPTQYFASAQRSYPGEVFDINRQSQDFLERNYRERSFGESLAPGDFSVGAQDQCREIVRDDTSIFSCFLFRTLSPEHLYLITLSEWNEIRQIYAGDDLQPVDAAEGEASLFAQYLGQQPTNQREVPLSEIPRYCLDAVLAIEDPHFLEHSGVSVRGILRAIAANLKNVRWSQGGSTITQQLVKNDFLSPEKTLWRKVKELVLALLLEFRVSKDQILETYLNIIYLGQSGVFEVRGYGAAAEFYFRKPVERLNLAECSLLAAIVNSPGRYNPVRQPERAKERRTRVLEKMVEHGFISQDEMTEAAVQDLPSKLNRHLADSASYYVDAVNKQLKNLGIEDRSGLKVYTGLQVKAQRAAEQAVREGLQALEANSPHLKKLRQEQGKPLQAILVSTDVRSGEITALVGGRDFASSPYNRAIESRRQVGSIFKPLVYLTAFEVAGKSPLEPLNNSPLKYEYERQVWEPKNYDNKFSAPVPVFYALKESLNVPTARLGLEVGLGEVIKTARSLGVTSPLKEYPALTLGAFELSPLEVLQVYTTLAGRGRGQAPILVKKVVNKQGETLYENTQRSEIHYSEASIDILISILEEAMRTGTGQAARRWGFVTHAAGKTGTTSDSKDTWFAGFTPRHTAVTWVGFDDGSPLNLTGASGALPLWTRYMQQVTSGESHGTFAESSETESRLLSAEELLRSGVPEDKAVDTTLKFRKHSAF